MFLDYLRNIVQLYWAKVNSHMFVAPQYDPHEYLKDTKVLEQAIKHNYVNLDKHSVLTIFEDNEPFVNIAQSTFIKTDKDGYIMCKHKKEDRRFVFLTCKGLLAKRIPGMVRWTIAKDNPNMYFAQYINWHTNARFSWDTPPNLLPDFPLHQAHWPVAKQMEMYMGCSLPKKAHTTKEYHKLIPVAQFVKHTGAHNMLGTWLQVAYNYKSEYGDRYSHLDDILQITKLLCLQVYGEEIGQVWDYFAMCRRFRQKAKTSRRAFDKHKRDLNIKAQKAALRGRKLSVNQHYLDIKDRVPFQLIQTKEDLVLEAVKQQHCVASYVDRINEGYTSIWRYKDYTIELRARVENTIDYETGEVLGEMDRTHYYITQVRGKHNRTAPEELRDEIYDIIDKINGI